MPAKIDYPHLTMKPDQTIRIGRSRYKVLHLAAERYQHGWTAEELLHQHPDLRPEEVYAALTYLYDHRDELVAEIKEILREVKSSRTAQPLSRDRLACRLTTNVQLWRRRTILVNVRWRLKWSTHVLLGDIF